MLDVDGRPAARSPRLAIFPSENRNALVPKKENAPAAFATGAPKKLPHFCRHGEAPVPHEGNGRVTWGGLWSSSKGMTYNRPPWPPESS